MSDAQAVTPAIDRAAERPFALVLLPIMAAVLSAFLVTGIALPVLPVHVHVGLGLSTFVVGLVSGSQFAASFVSRLSAGRFADMRGAKIAVVTGLAMMTAAGLIYLLSLHFVARPDLSAAVLILGRAVLGGGESFTITGAMAWGLAIGGPQNTGRVIAWLGTAMYTAFALGAPIGTALYAAYGFTAVCVTTAALPFVTLAIVLPVRSVPPSMQARPSFLRVIGAVWEPGLGLALSSLGFGVTTAFVTLLFISRGWTPAWPGVTLFALAFIAIRSLLGHLPDTLGGARVALVSVFIEAAGLGAIWLAPSWGWAYLAAAVVGAGYSLVYPGFGVEAVRRAPPESRGLAMGAYTASLDVALGTATPALGLLATSAGLGIVFLVSAVVVLLAAPIAWRLARPLVGPGAGSRPSH